MKPVFIFFLTSILTISASAQSKPQTLSVLWKIESPQNHQISYLLGTNHLFGNAWLTAHPKADSLLKASNVFMCEVTTFKNTEKPDTTTIVQVKAKELFGKDFDKVNEYFVKETGEGLTANIDTDSHPVEVLNSMARYLLDKIVNKNGIAVGYEMMDQVLLQTARSNNIPSVQLDDFKVLGAIATFKTIDDQKIKSITDMVNYLTDTVSASKKNKQEGDFADLNLYNQGKGHFNFGLADRGGEELAKAITRNNLWMKIIPRYLNKGKTFIAVGAGHLNGKDGLIVQLKKRGYKLTPVSL